MACSLIFRQYNTRYIFKDCLSGRLILFCVKGRCQNGSGHGIEILATSTAKATLLKAGQQLS